MFSAFGSLFSSALIPAITKSLPSAVAGLGNVITSDIPDIFRGKNVIDVLKSRGQSVLEGVGQIGKDTISGFTQALNGTTDNAGNIALSNQFDRRVDMNMNNRTVPSIQPSMVNDQGAGSINMATLGANKPPLEQQIVDKEIDNTDINDTGGDSEDWMNDDYMEEVIEKGKYLQDIIGRARRGEKGLEGEIFDKFKNKQYADAYNWAFGKVGKEGKLAITKNDINRVLKGGSWD